MPSGAGAPRFFRACLRERRSPPRGRSSGTRFSLTNGRSSANHSLIQMARRRQAQLALSLRAPARWGGARSGAGRKVGPKPLIRHSSREPFRKPLPAHVTLRMRDDVPSLRLVKVVQAIERTFARGCARPGFRLVHYSLQGNHAHLVVEAQDQAALGRGMKAIGARLALAVNRVTEHAGRVLADRYHMRLLRTPREVHRALRYVLLNARRHSAVKARTAVRAIHELLDPASSARWFDGWKREKLGTGRARAPRPHTDPPAVARARTWLLSVGWRRHGLLDPAAVPGPS